MSDKPKLESIEKKSAEMNNPSTKATFNPSAIARAVEYEMSKFYKKEEDEDEDEDLKKSIADYEAKKEEASDRSKIIYVVKRIIVDQCYCENIREETIALHFSLDKAKAMLEANAGVEEDYLSIIEWNLETQEKRTIHVNYMTESDLKQIRESIDRFIPYSHLIYAMDEQGRVIIK